MRPSLYHVHDDERQWAGEQDVHGRIIGPRYKTFPDEPGLTYLGFGDRNAALDAFLVQPDAIFMPNFGSFLSSDRLAFEFKVVARSHHVYFAIPQEPNESTVVLWWRRLRATTRMSATPYQFPWENGDELILIERDSRAFGMKGMVLSVSGNVGKSATGYVALQVASVGRGGEITRDVERGLYDFTAF